MELLNIITARAIWLFDAAELNPRGKRTSPSPIIWLKEKYGFEKCPASADDKDQSNALVFSRGNFVSTDGNPIYVDLKLYNDGVIVDTFSSTHDSEMFIQNVLEGCVEELGWTYKPGMIRRKLLLSEVHFQSAKSLFGLNKKLSDFATKLSTSIPDGLNTKFDFSGVYFLSGPVLPNAPISKFSVERKANTLPYENKFFSTAQLHTDVHLELLNEFEVTFMK